MPIRDNRLKYVNTRIWETEDSPSFPEQAVGHPDSIGDKAKVGVCFSGGGTRSATCTHGQLKALNDFGLLDKIGYISCVSGGAWAAIPFTYLSEHWEDSHFFGTVYEPEKLTLDVLNDVSKRNYLYSVTHAGIVDDIAKHWARFSGDETFSRAIGDVFLHRFGLNSREKFFAYTENHVEDILTRNERMNRDDFYTVRSGRPFLIATGAFLRFGSKDYLFEMTPWYTGVQEFYKKSLFQKRDIGGGYIESFAFDSDSPDFIDNQTADVRIGNKNHRFTLSDVLGTTGAAPSEVLDNAKLNFIGFPEFKYWPAKNVGKVKAKEYEIGDGGNIENLGILPLLKRGVERIIIFVNTKKPLSLKNKTQINGSIKALFKQGGVNHVFESQELKFLQDGLLEKLGAEKATTYTGIYTVLANEHHGVVGGNKVKILWVYNHNYVSWEKKLPAEVSKKIGKGRLSNFPHFATFGENIPKLINLHAVQANLLSHMSCAVVRDNIDEFLDIISN